MLNALAQVDVKNREVLKTLNEKLETLDGTLQDTDDEDLCRILNGRLTQAEYRVANAADRLTDDKDRDWFQKHCETMVSKHFSAKFSDTFKHLANEGSDVIDYAAMRNLFFGDYVSDDDSENRPYEEVADRDA